MHAPGSNLGITCIQTPRSSSVSVPNLPERGGFDLSQQNVRSQEGFSTDWRTHPEMTYWKHFIRNKISEILRSRVHHQQAQGLYVIAEIIGVELLLQAASKEEYLNQETLLKRVQIQLNEMYRTKGSQQQVNNNGNCWGTVQKNKPWDFHTAAMGKPLQSESSKLMIPQHVLRVNSEVSNPSPGWNSNSILGDIRQCQPQPMHLQQSFKPSIQPNELCGKSTTVQTGSCFEDMSGKKTLKRPWLNSCNNSQAMLRPDKILKRMSDFGLSFNDYAISDQRTPKMSQPYSSDQGLPELQQQRETSISSTFYDVAECHAEHFANPQVDSMSICDINNNVNDGDTFGQTFKNETIPSFGQIFKNETIPSFGQIFKNQTIPSFGQIFKNETIPSKGLEGGQISEESELRSHDTVDSRNFMETDTRLNSSMHTLSSDPIAADIEDIYGKTGVSDLISEQFENPMHDSMPVMETIHSKGLEAGHMSLESDPNHDVDKSNLQETVLCKDRNVADVKDINGRTGVADCIVEPFKNPMPDSMGISEIKSNAIDGAFGKVFKGETLHSQDLEACHISEESDPKNHVPTDGDNSKETEISLSSSMHSLSDVPIAADVEDISGGIGFNLAGINGEKKVSEAKVDEKKETKVSKATANIASLTEFFTSNEIREHITSLRKQPVQSIPGEETAIDANSTCQLCAMKKLDFAPVPIYCSCCGKKIGLNKNYYSKRAEEFDAQNCFCTGCYKKSRGKHLKFNQISVPKALLDIKKNDEVLAEGWVQCDKCSRWQHQICALYNKKRDLDSSAEYICPICRLKEIEEGMHVSLPKTDIFGAKDLPSTMLSDHIEKRLFKRLMQERVDREQVEGTKNLDEVLATDSLSVKVVLSVDKQLEVKKQFLDIFPKHNYPAEFPYTSKVILLFQKIDGADVCLFAMYVQEFGSECGNPNQRCVYVSYLDSVKYFRPERETIRGEALRTLVYHEILIGYLDFCKKRGFTTCYIWACPPTKGEDYILYCHPSIQKIPKNDKLRHWYLSMLRKAAEENIVVGLSNIYDHFFVPTAKWDSKVTASRLPYFDGDFWSSRAMDIAGDIEKESGGEYEKTLKKVTKRALNALGHVKPSKGTAKDILVMQKLGQDIFPFKDDFIIVHLQHTCVHCQEVIISGKRWFCTECKKFQECERCHTADSHTSNSGKKHKLCQVLMEDVPLDTKENDIVLDNQLFENRHNFLSFCQKNHLQFNTLRHAKYSSMMILYHLMNSSICSICGGEHNKFQHSWRCESCHEFSACSACYKERGAECHEHKLSQALTSLSVSRKEELEESKQKSTLTPTRTQKLLKVLPHASPITIRAFRDLKKRRESRYRAAVLKSKQRTC